MSFDKKSYDREYRKEYYLKNRSKILDNSRINSAKYYKSQPYIAHLNAKLQNIIAYGYFAKPFSGRCSSQVRSLESDGQLVADYFECDKFQRLINRE